MSRVHKQFAKNMAWPAGILTGYVATGIVSGYLGSLAGYQYHEAFPVGPLLLSVFLLVGLLLRIEWNRAREKVKQENEDIMRALKDD